MVNNDSQRETELQVLLQEIDLAFASILPPDGWQEYSTLDDFANLLGDRFLSEYWELIYDLEPSVTRYIFPFVMRYFAMNVTSGAEDALNLDYLLAKLTQSYVEEFGTSGLFEVVSTYSEDQRDVVCHWLRYIRKFQTLPSAECDVVLKQWC